MDGKIFTSKLFQKKVGTAPTVIHIILMSRVSIKKERKKREENAIKMFSFGSIMFIHISSESARTYQNSLQFAEKIGEEKRGEVTR